MKKQDRDKISHKETRKMQPLADRVVQLGEEKYSKYTDEQLHDMTAVFKQMLKDGKTLDDLLPDAFAVVRESAKRVLGKEPYYVQILGGIALHQGKIAEMVTGSGKTLTETMPVYLNALEGKGVHVVTVNDYLAKRDSEEMGKIYNFLGMSVGLVTGQDKSKASKQRAYACDITYATNNELGFDYLRDNMVQEKGNITQRSHHYAIVDEVDSILIDEARTPLIISDSGTGNTDAYGVISGLARRMTRDCVNETESGELQFEDSEFDYIVHEKKKIVTITPHGIKTAEEWLGIDNLMAKENALCYHMLMQALKAYGIMKRNKDYVVKDGEVLIVDEFTGRTMPGRQFNEGLHQAIQAKEFVDITPETRTFASVTFQSYFRMYDKLAGMTGTAYTEKEEFKDIYNLDIVVIPTNEPVQRVDKEDILYLTESEKYGAVIAKIVECHKNGQPVLVGTPSIEKSELLAARLKNETDVSFNILNAKNHELEAEVVAQAGRFGAVTISTNMAGRGTDIMLGGNPEFMAKKALKEDSVCADIIKKYSGLIQMENESEETLEIIEKELIEQADRFKRSDNPLVLETRKKYKELVAKYRKECLEEGERVKAVGGLCVIGCERHESRRIDNQLRGRSGRQGDPGESQFYVSLEDSLISRFGNIEKIRKRMQSLGVESEDLQSSKSGMKYIEKAQKEVEGMHFEQRKNVFEYDLVINEQRLRIYKERRLIMESENVYETLYKDMLKQDLENHYKLFYKKKKFDYDEFKSVYGEILFNDIYPLLREKDLDGPNKKENLKTLTECIDAFMKIKRDTVGTEGFNTMLKNYMLSTVDYYWRRHLNDIEYLKKGIYLMGYAQKDPKVEFKTEAYNIYDIMLKNIIHTYLIQSFSLAKTERPEQ